MAGHRRRPLPDNIQVAWSINEWARSVGVSRSYVTAMISANKIESVKLGYKRLITTPPGEFVKLLPKTAPHEKRGRGRPKRTDPLP